MSLLFINTGGTFNKLYNPLEGTLDVPKDSSALTTILANYPHLDHQIVNILHKDSLDINDDDRAVIVQTINDCDFSSIIIVHGTDTMQDTASFIDKHANIKDKTIVLTGAMKPFEINPSEATTNIGMCVGFLAGHLSGGVHICMSGLVQAHQQIYKNKSKGLFELR